MSSQKLTILLIVLVAFFGASYSRMSPNFIKPCPGLKSDCLTKNVKETIPYFVKGLPSLGIEPADPLQVKHLALALAGGLKIEFLDGSVTGFRKCTVDNVKYETLEAELDMHCTITIKGKYKANGQVLIFPIIGNGDAKIKTPNMPVKIKIQFEDKTHDDGLIYREIKSHKVSFEYNDRVTFNFTNLFNGNPELSETVLAFLNENWKEIVDEFGKPVTDTIIRLAFNSVKKFFSAIPRDELFVS